MQIQILTASVDKHGISTCRLRPTINHYEIAHVNPEQLQMAVPKQLLKAGCSKVITSHKKAWAGHALDRTWPVQDFMSFGSFS